MPFQKKSILDVPGVLKPEQNGSKKGLTKKGLNRATPFSSAVEIDMFPAKLINIYLSEINPGQIAYIRIKHNNNTYFIPLKEITIHDSLKSETFEQDGKKIIIPGSKHPYTSVLKTKRNQEVITVRKSVFKRDLPESLLGTVYPLNNAEFDISGRLAHKNKEQGGISNFFRGNMDLIYLAHDKKGNIVKPYTLDEIFLPRELATSPAREFFYTMGGRKKADFISVKPENIHSGKDGYLSIDQFVRVENSTILLPKKYFLK